MADASRLAASDPRAALELLDGLRGPAYALVTFGGALHHPFAALVRELLGWRGEPPEVRARPWSSWTRPPTAGRVLAFLERIPEPIAYLFDPPGPLSRGPAAEIEALHALATDPDLAMVVTGDASALVRREAALRAAPHARPGSRDPLGELGGAARRTGQRVLTLLG